MILPNFNMHIFLQVIRDTNFLENLYEEEELSSEKDRDGKMKFLQKLIDVVSEWKWNITWELLII